MADPETRDSVMEEEPHRGAVPENCLAGG